MTKQEAIAAGWFTDDDTVDGLQEHTGNADVTGRPGPAASAVRANTATPPPDTEVSLHAISLPRRVTPAVPPATASAPGTECFSLSRTVTEQEAPTDKLQEHTSNANCVTQSVKRGRPPKPKVRSSVTQLLTV